ncbi:MAG: hypothetical protein IKO03_03880 [Lachnospiraceae bacterium]|nr:hypothetical protein [Lachnospiraceae bacterium]MBR4606852.1 hypothetical protein [Lachnospiraceae bacterium]
MKKIVTMLLLFVAVLTISACSDGKSSPDSRSEKETQGQKSKSGNSDGDEGNSDGEAQNKNKEYDIDLSKHLKVGDFIQFGTYEQDNSTDNGPERIEWQVLDIAYGKIFVMSRYALDSQPFNKDDSVYAWDKCSIRDWLNNDFYDKAFSAKEKDLIQLTELTTKQKNEKITTEDKVFLLSNLEVYHYLRYLSIEGESSSFCHPTAFSVEQGVKTSAETENRCDWFIRNAYAPDDARFVNAKRGTVDYDAKVTRDNIGIRPAMWLSYENISLKDAEVGDTVFFGTYNQGATVLGSDGLNHYLIEPIAWTVLDIQDGQKMLITKSGIVGYNYGNSPWENSHLRKCLNSYFYDEAFSEEDKSKIIETTLANPDNDVYGTDGGNDTTDKVFVLSVPEVEKYFGGSRDEDNPLRACYSPTELGTNGAGNLCSWFTRTPGKDQQTVAFIDYYEIGSKAGHINMEGTEGRISGISAGRPVIWVQP